MDQDQKYMVDETVNQNEDEVKHPLAVQHLQENSLENILRSLPPCFFLPSSALITQKS